MIRASRRTLQGKPEPRKTNTIKQKELTMKTIKEYGVIALAVVATYAFVYLSLVANGAQY